MKGVAFENGICGDFYKICTVTSLCNLCICFFDKMKITFKYN